MVSFDLVVLGATGYTGRQLVRALRRQAKGQRIALAGRRVEALAELAGSDFGVLPADLNDDDSLRRVAAQGRVMLNLAGPYAERGEAVVAACIEAGCHHLDLSGEVFWMRQLLRRQHDRARLAGLLLVPACGYEALPFDLAAQALARHLQLRHGERCVQLDIAVLLRGSSIRRLSDAVSGGTLASMRSVLQHDQGNSLQRMDCLLPEELPSGWNANAVALANAAPLAPWWDADWASVMAPALPAPFINPPLLLRSAAMAPEAFAPGFRYREGLLLRGEVEARLGGIARALPGQSWAQIGLGGTSLAAQWSAGAALAAPLAAFGAAAGGRRGRQALQRLSEWLGPRPGEGPSEAQLDGMDWQLRCRALGDGGTVLRALLEADGHPGYRSTPEMMAAVGLALADGRLGAGKSGLLSPGAAFGCDGLSVLQSGAGLRWLME